MTKHRQPAQHFNTEVLPEVAFPGRIGFDREATLLRQLLIDQTRVLGPSPGLDALPASER